jgi:O-antigen ligase
MSLENWRRFTVHPHLPLWQLGTLFLGAMAAGTLAPLGSLERLSLIALAAVALTLLVPWVTVPLLIVASALDRYEVVFGQVRIRYDIIAVLVIAMMLMARLAVRTLRVSDLRIPLLPPMLAYIGINLVSTALYATERSRGLQLDAELLMIVPTYGLLFVALRGRRDIERALKWLWIVTVAEASVGIVGMLLYAINVSNYGVTFSAEGLPMAFGTQWEPNILGSFLLGNFFLLLGDYMRGQASRMRALSLSVVLIGIAVSMTRTVWLALILGVVVFLTATTTHRQKRGHLILVLLPIMALGGLLLGATTSFGSRLLQLVDLQTSSASGRVALYQAALQEWRQHPLLGLGTGSFNVGASPGLPHPWLPNIFLLAVHDTGVLGLAVLLWLLICFYRPVLAAMRSRDDMAFVVAGSIAGFTSLLLAFQTTTGFWFMYPWIVAGIGSRAAVIATGDTE